MWDVEAKQEPAKERHDAKKSVSFLKGADGEPWVWVMGEHENDRSIEDIIKEEAMDEARRLAEKEAEELRRRVEEELKLGDYMDLTPKIEDLAERDHLKMQDDIYCSVDELRDKMNGRPTMMKNLNNYTLSHYQNKNGRFAVFDTRDVLNELNRNATQKVAQKVALWEKRLTEERTCEILKKMQKLQMEAAKEAEEAEIKQEQLWMEQGKESYDF